MDELPRGRHLRPHPPLPEGAEATLAALAEVASDWETAARHLPLAELPAFKKVAPYWREWLEHPSYDAFWKRVDQTAKAGAQGPVAPGGRLVRQLRARTLRPPGRDVQSIRGRAKGRSRLVIGPWDHEAYLSVRPTASGSREFGPAAVGGVTLMSDLVLGWFDQWLKGEEPHGVGLRSPCGTS